MIIITLGALIIILIFFGLLESYFHRLAISQLPVRIHVNGSRGKSSVTRLIAAGLRAGGIKTLAKTTGTAPRIIDEKGADGVIHRLRSASIGEQVKLLRTFSRKKPDAVVMECMAVNPQYQWISEHKMIQSTISVITNVRPDHIDEMGYTLKDNARCLSNTIPFNGKLVTVSGDMNLDGQVNSDDEEINNIFLQITNKRNTILHQASSEEVPDGCMDEFGYHEHIDNVALALKVCELSGVDKEIAIGGMVKTQPDPGATIIWQLNFSGNKNYFVNLLAANDPESTIKIYEQLELRISSAPICIFLNTRNDRRYRTHQLLDLVFNRIKPKILIIRGENMPSQFDNYKKESPKVEICQLPYDISINEMIKEFNKLDGYYIIGIGNMVGWGEKFMQDLKRYRI